MILLLHSVRLSSVSVGRSEVGGGVGGTEVAITTHKSTYKGL